MTVRSYYDIMICKACDARILGDTREALTRDPYQHEDDCPDADPWEADESDS